MASSSKESDRKPGSLLSGLNQVVRGNEYVDMSAREFLLAGLADVEKHRQERLNEYAATLHVIGLLAGVVGTAEEQKALRDQVSKAITDYINSIQKVFEKDKIYLVGGFDDPMLEPIVLQGAWLFSHLSGSENGRKYAEEAGKRNYQNAQLAAHMIEDLVVSIWNSLVNWWNDFWKVFEEKGLLVALAKLKVDFEFFAAECALDIAMSIALAGLGAAVAAALKGLRFVGQRVGTTMTKVVIHAIPNNAKHVHFNLKKVHEVHVYDQNLDPKISSKVLDENNLGVHSHKTDAAVRQEIKPDTANTDVVHGDKDKHGTGAARKVKELPCFSVPPGMNAQELKRQLNEQMSVINSMTADQMGYAMWVRDAAGGTQKLRNSVAQRSHRAEYEKLLEGKGLLGSEIEKIMNGLDATHMLDMIAGGDPAVFSRDSAGQAVLGDSRVNRHIGNQWTVKDDGITRRADILRNEAHAMRKAGLHDHKMNIKMEICK